MKFLSLFTGALLLFAMTASAQRQGGQGSAPEQTPSQTPSQVEPPATTAPAPAPTASSSKTISGTVESLTEGKSMKVRTAEGKVKSVNLRDAAVDPGVKVGSAVKVSQSRDVNGKGSGAGGKARLTPASGASEEALRRRWRRRFEPELPA